MRYPKLRELKEAIRALIKGPVTIKFPYAPSPAFEKFRGRPKYYKDECVGCTACAQVCPVGAIEVEDDKKLGTRTLKLRYDTCIFCGNCQANCLTQEGIKLSTEYDLATYKREEAVEKVEKKLVLCSCCGEVVAPEDHLVWVAKHVGSAAYSNPTLYLAYLKDLNLAYEDLKGISQESARDQRMSVVCTSCRRKTTLKG